MNNELRHPDDDSIGAMTERVEDNKCHDDGAIFSLPDEKESVCDVCGGRGWLLNYKTTIRHGRVKKELIGQRRCYCTYSNRKGEVKWYL